MTSGKNETVTLTVITPDSRQGLATNLRKELLHAGVKYQIIHDDWLSGLDKAEGDFILLMEYDSAIEHGSIERLLKPFRDRPHYRKLAMVSPRIEFEDSEPTRLTFGETDSLLRVSPHEARVGSIAGSVIRKHSLLKHREHISDNVIDSSYSLSFALWGSGLRIIHAPKAVYCSPKSAEEVAIVESDSPSLEVINLWDKELIV